MPTLAPTSRGTQDAPTSDPFVAGRIDAAGDSIRPLILEYEQTLIGFGRKAATAYVYRMVLLSCAEDCSWSSHRDITLDSVENLIRIKRSTNAWIGDTVNRNVCIVRGFLKFLDRRGLADRHMLEDLPTSKSDGGPGVRAATREEARRHMLASCARSMTCGYRQANRPLQHLIMFLNGLRPGEASKLEWKRHIMLDCDIPHIHWTRDIQKNNREQDVVLHAELVTLLKMHREDMRKMAKHTPVVVVKNKRDKKKPDKSRPVSPDVEGSFVFPIVSGCFNKDAERAGIKKKDHRGRSYAPRSARKFFSTDMTRSGVAQMLVKYIMRHKGGVEMRYFDPTMEDQLLAITKLAPLAPEVMHNPRVGKKSSLTNREDDGHDVPDEDAKHDYNFSANPAGSEPRASSSVSKRSGDAGLTDPLQSGSAQKSPVEFDSSSFSESLKAADRS
ncbi:MAG: tyrosine-type recombinase/integrase [Phycisphaerales bacterium]